MIKKPKVKLKKTPFDTYLFSIILVLASLLFLYLRITLTTNGPKVVNVYVENKLIDTLDLSVNQTKVYYKSDYDVFLDDITLEIKDNKVRVEKEESPRHYCSIQGYVGDVGKPVICLPNSFYFVIEVKK
jgi:hypothetical protein